MENIGSYVFYVDEGAVYDVSFYSDGTGYVTGRNTQVTYTSPDHLLVLTGKRRRQPTGTLSPRRPYYVLGYRAILTLDTGEGLSELRGVAV